MGNRAADSKHGSRVEGCLHLALKAINPSKGFLHFETPHIYCCTLYVLYCIIPYIFLLYRLKINQVKGFITFVFILGPVSVVANNNT